MKFINLTPHIITEITSGQSFKPSGIIARVKSSTEKISSHSGCPIYKSVFGDIEGLPNTKPDTIYIVSALALNAVPAHRTDVVAPGNLQRNQEGQPIGCMGFRVK